MRVSVLIPTYRRPAQLAQALESLAWQDRELIGEILVGDDSPASLRAENEAVIAASAVADLVRYLPNEPALGNYPNQWSLGAQARFDHIMILHDDDQLQEGGLDVLVRACMTETDERVRIWFGKDVIMDAAGQIDPRRTVANDVMYGKDGPSRALPAWDWCLSMSLPPDASLIRRDAYVSMMRGERDGNVGDWGFHVRLANSGAWGRFVAEAVSRYRVQPESMTNRGLAVDVHYMYEIAKELRVPPAREADKNAVVRRFVEVATVRYMRHGEHRRAWRCFTSHDWRWPRRLSPRGVATIGMLLLPASLTQCAVIGA